MSSTLVKYTKTDFKKLVDTLETIKQYKDVVKIRKLLNFSASSKLRLFPDSGINNRLNHLLQIAKYAASRPEIIYGFEGETMHGTNIDFDLLTSHDGKVFIMWDFTTNPALIEEKSSVLEFQSENFIQELSDRNLHVTVRTRVKVVPQNSLFHISFKEDKSNLFDSTYKIIDSITEANINELEPLCETFINEYKKRSIDSTFPKLDKSIHMTNEDAASWVRIAQENSSITMADYEGMNHDITSFNKECYKVSRQLASLADTARVRNHILPTNTMEPRPVDKHDNSFALQNPIYRALYLIKQRAEEKQWFSVTTSFQLTRISPPKELFASDEYILEASWNESNNFSIIWNRSFVDSNLSSAIIRSNAKKNEKPKVEDFKEPEVALWNTEPEGWPADVETVWESVRSRIMNKKAKLASDSIVSKTLDVLNSNMQALERGVDFVLSVAADSTMKALAESALLNIIESQYEVAKGFATTINYAKRPFSYDIVYVAAYQCVMIKQRNATLESFKNGFYFLIYKSSQTFTESDVRRPFRIYGESFQTESSSFNRNTLAWALKKPFVHIMLTSWLVENRDKALAKDSFVEASFDSYNIININRDDFSTCAEQVRYLYVSTTGRGSVPNNILSKLKRFSPRNLYEIVYIGRMIKMAAALFALKSSSNLTWLRDEKLQNNHFNVAMPQDIGYHGDFNYTVSSFYICNVFNKFRYNVEVSEAICYEGLIEEDQIFRDALEMRKNEVLGLSKEVIIDGYETFWEILNNSYEDELTYALNISRDQPTRFTFSLTLL